MNSSHPTQNPSKIDVGNEELVIDIRLSGYQLVMEQKNDREIIPLFDNVVSVENLMEINAGHVIKDMKNFHIPDNEIC